MQRKAFILSIFLSVSIFVFLFSQSFMLSPFHIVASLFSVPRASFYGFVYARTEDTSMSRLKNENLHLKEQLVELSTLRKDNVALRSQFEETNIQSNSLIPAKIVGLKGSPKNPTGFVIDQGLKSGVSINMPVVIGKQLVGKVTQVDAYFSEIILVVNKNFSTIAESLNHKSPGIINGFDEFMLFDHVVITDTISKKEIVITKGEIHKNGIGIPPGLIIGEIVKVNKSDTKPFQSARVQSLINFSSLSTVFVIKQ